MKKKYKRLLLFFLTLIVLVLLYPILWVSRMGRPAMKGRILDYQNRPIANCKVGEVLTDSLGNFVLPERRYSKFIIPEIFYMEAPPLFIREYIEQKGFESDRIEIFHRYGGGLSKGSAWNMGNIYLKRMDEKMNLEKLLQSEWQLSATKKMDTVFLVDKRLPDTTQSKKFIDFYNIYQQYTDNYLNSFGPNNLPEGIIRKYVNLAFDQDKNIRISKVIQYGNKNGGSSKDEQKENDTLYYQGKWKSQNDSVMLFETNDRELNGQYQIIKSDLFFLELRKM